MEMAAKIIKGKICHTRRNDAVGQGFTDYE
jgi:hypothetical protein